MSIISEAKKDKQGFSEGLSESEIKNLLRLSENDIRAWFNGEILFETKPYISEILSKISEELQESDACIGSFKRINNQVMFISSLYNDRYMFNLSSNINLLDQLMEQQKAYDNAIYNANQENVEKRTVQQIVLELKKENKYDEIINNNRNNSEEKVSLFESMEDVGLDPTHGYFYADKKNRLIFVDKQSINEIDVISQAFRAGSLRDINVFV